MGAKNWWQTPIPEMGAKCIHWQTPIPEMGAKCIHWQTPIPEF